MNKEAFLHITDVEKLKEMMVSWIHDFSVRGDNAFNDIWNLSQETNSTVREAAYMISQCFYPRYRNQSLVASPMVSGVHTGA